MKKDNRSLFPILRYFSYRHLPDHLQELSKPFCDIAEEMVSKSTPSSGPEVAAGLRKLLEAKDCFVRAEIK